MRLLEVVRALRGEGTGDPLADIHAGFLELASAAFGRLLRGRDDVAELVRRVSAGGLVRVVLAPETTSRLFSDEAPDAVVDFIRAALAVELARDGHRVRTGRPLWSALGDAVVRPTGAPAAAPAVAGAPPLDVDSPYARRLELSGAQRTVALSPLAALDRERVVAALAEAVERIAATGDDVRQLVQRFVRVIALRHDGESEFEVTSNGQHVGRVVVFGSRWEDVDAAALAEMLVHEAIHSLLLMEERRQPWLLPPSLYALPERVVSPWTGSALRVDSFIHACFVWYGVLEFWRRAEDAASFPAAMVEPRAARAASGFLLGSPLARLEAVANDIAPELRAAIEEMHARAVDMRPERTAAWS